MTTPKTVPVAAVESVVTRLPLILFECKVGGATYWVAALHAEHARELLYLDSEEMGSDPDDVDDAAIAECPMDRAERLRYTTDDDEHRSMWGEFLRGNVMPRIVACSEWP